MGPRSVLQDFHILYFQAPDKQAKVFSKVCFDFAEIFVMFENSKFLYFNYQCFPMINVFSHQLMVPLKNKQKQKPAKLSSLIRGVQFDSSQTHGGYTFY